TAHGMYRQLEYRAVLRGANIDTLQLILSGHLSFDELADLGFDFAQLLGHVAAEILIDLDDLQLDFGNLALDLGRRRYQLPPLSRKPGLVALQCREPG